DARPRSRTGDSRQEHGSSAGGNALFAHPSAGLMAGSSRRTIAEEDAVEHVRMNRRRLLRTGLATTVALGAAALPGPSWATTAGSHLHEDRAEGGREDDSDRDADDRARGHGRTRASGQVIRTW